MRCRKGMLPFLLSFLLLSTVGDGDGGEGGGGKGKGSSVSGVVCWLLGGLGAGLRRKKERLLK